MSQRQSHISNAQGVETQKLILETSGKIFGQKGYDGACFREISQESGVGLSSIVYHFKSKKNLYLQTLRHFIIDRARLNELFEPIVGLLDKPGTPQEIADALRDSFRNVLESCHGPDKAQYMNELYTGIMTGGDPEALGMLLECFVDIQQRLPQFLQHYWPNMTEQDQAFWIQLFWAQLQYTIMGRTLILYDMKLGDHYPAAFLDKAAWHFAYYCCLPLGLPEPTRYPPT